MILHCGKYQLDLTRPLVMGIVNVTPDSFSDGGRYLSHPNAISHAEQLIRDGADMLDIGGESTRPGAQIVSEQEELDRVMPVIEALRDCGTPLSIDTLKPSVMHAAIRAGVHLVNDVNALQEKGAVEVVASSEVAVCLMHKRGNPATMQHQPEYTDVLNEVLDFLQQRMDVVNAAGIRRERIVLDPGFGFGKTLEHNLQLLKNLQRFAGFGVPVLAGLSRKSMLGLITSREVEHRMAASVAAALVAVQHGANIVRVHDVRETVDALKVWQAVNG